MQSTDSLAARVRSGYLEALAVQPAEVLQLAGAPTSAEAAVRQSRDLAVPVQCRDRILEAVVRAYRIGHRQLWGPVLLEILGPQLTEWVQQFWLLEPLVDSEDLAQQLVVEVLSAAATIPLPQGARWVERRLLRRAGFMVARWLYKQTQLVRAAVDLDSTVVSHEAYRVYLQRRRIEAALAELYPDGRKRRQPGRKGEVSGR